MVVTRSIKKYIQEIEGKKPKKDGYDYKYVQYTLYMKRVQKRIERELNMLLWLAINEPDILLAKDLKHFDGKERIRKIMLTVKALIGKNMDPELFLDLDKISSGVQNV